MGGGVLKALIDRQIRISVSNLDLDALGVLPGDTKVEAMEKVFHALGHSRLRYACASPCPTLALDRVRQLVGDGGAKFGMDLDMVWGTDGKEMRLQAIEHAQSPINRHPSTGRPVWFCNMHNRALLRERHVLGAWVRTRARASLAAPRPWLAQTPLPTPSTSLTRWA